MIRLTFSIERLSQYSSNQYTAIHPQELATNSLCYFMGCIWFDVCWCYVVVWLWWCGIRMQAEALHTDTTPP